MIKKFLLETSTCGFYLRGKYELDQKIINNGGLEQCCISEITLAELMAGVEKSEYRDKNQQALDVFLTQITILPIRNILKIFAREKARLELMGNPIDNFDLLIGCTAAGNDLIIVTDNVRHFERIQNIKIENWITRRQ